METSGLPSSKTLVYKRSNGPVFVLHSSAFAIGDTKIKLIFVCGFEPGWRLLVFSMVQIRTYDGQEKDQKRAPNSSVGPFVSSFLQHQYL